MRESVVGSTMVNLRLQMVLAAGHVGPEIIVHGEAPPALDLIEPEFACLNIRIVYHESIGLAVQRHTEVDVSERLARHVINGYIYMISVY